MPSTDALTRDRSVRRSLSSRRDYVKIGASILVGIGLAAVLCVPERIPGGLVFPFRINLGDHALRLAAPIAAFPLMVMLLLIGAVLTPLRWKGEQRWLGALPFPFAHRGYLMVLKHESGTNNLQLLLTFDHHPPQQDFEQLSRMRLPGSKLVWQDEACVMVRSPPGLGAKTGYTRAAYNNAELHHWFRRVAAPFLVSLHAKAGLKKVELRS